MNADTAITVTLDADSGDLLDAALDNAAALASQAGQSARAQQCLRIRETFWDQDSQTTGQYTLSRDDWAAAIRELNADDTAAGDGEQGVLAARIETELAQHEH